MAICQLVWSFDPPKARPSAASAGSMVPISYDIQRLQKGLLGMVGKMSQLNQFIGSSSFFLQKQLGNPLILNNVIGFFLHFSQRFVVFFSFNSSTTMVNLGLQIGRN